jgi:hypothetical protein
MEEILEFDQSKLPKSSGVRSATTYNPMESKIEEEI